MLIIGTFCHWAQLQYISHTARWSRSYINIIDTIDSILALLQVYHHVDGRGLDSAGCTLSREKKTHFPVLILPSEFRIGPLSFIRLSVNPTPDTIVFSALREKTQMTQVSGLLLGIFQQA